MTSDPVMAESVGQCEDCGGDVTLKEAQTESFPSPEGRIVLMFCPGCRDKRKEIRESV